MIKCIKMLENFTQGLLLYQKHLFYRICILPITLYNFSLWHYNKVPLSFSLKKLIKMQHKAALQILDVFHTSSILGTKAIASLILIHLHLQKLRGIFYLRAHSHSLNHIIKLILEMRSLNNVEPHCLLLERLIPRQYAIIKSLIVDIDNRFNEVFLFFSPFNYKIFLMPLISITILAGI